MKPVTLYVLDDPIKPKGWLPQLEWIRIQNSVPILCVDIVPISTDRGDTKVGLIRRDTPHQGKRWCLIGGRMLRNEPFDAAVRRHLRESVGRAVRVVFSRPFEPILTTEYFTTRRRDALYDPRQHAVGIVFVVGFSGRVRPGGEAHEYRWFSVRNIPTARSFGFGQNRVLREVISRLDVVQEPKSKRSVVHLTRISLALPGVVNERDA